MARDQDKKSVIFIQFRSISRCRLCLVAAAPVYGWQQAHNRSNVNVTYMRDKPFNARLRRDLELITEELLINSMRYGATQHETVTIIAWLDATHVWDAKTHR